MCIWRALYYLACLSLFPQSSEELKRLGVVTGLVPESKEDECSATLCEGWFSQLQSRKSFCKVGKHEVRC